MRTRLALPIALVLLALVPQTASAGIPGAGEAATGHGAAFAPGEAIVRFRPGLPAAARAAALRERGVRLERSLSLPGIVLARVPAGDRVRQAVSRLERDPRVAWAEPNSYAQGGALPNDPFLPETWGLRRIAAPEAWDRTTGAADVKVAVVDSGVNLRHPELAPNIWRNPGESGGGREANGLDDDGNGFVDDWRGWDFVQRDNEADDNYGHGTHVAGTIAARGDNGLGIAGVAWRASLIPVRVLDNLNTGLCADIAEGLAYAVRAGARVVNLSLGSRFLCQAQRSVIDSAPNTLFVVAAMNEGSDVETTPWYPCSFPSPNVVCVAATDSGDRLAGFSNYGAQSVDLAAPGVNVLSSYVKWGAVENLFFDGFETPIDGRWVTGGSPDTWDRSPFTPILSGGFSLSNSPLGDYGNNTDSWARLTQGLDLTGRRDCAARVWLRASLGPYDLSRPLDADHLIAETSADGVDWSHRPSILFGTNSSFEKWLIDLSELEGRSTGGLRFRLRTNAGGTYDGVALDDLTVLCVPPLDTYTGARDEFEFDQGTSMAAPHVAGTAVLLLSLDPGMSAATLRSRILGSVDRLPALAGKVATGGRLNAARALAPPPSAPPPAPPLPPPPPAALPSQASALEVNLAALSRALSRGGLRSVRRAGGFRADRLHALSPGRFVLSVRAAGRTIARGSASTERPAICSLTARLTRRGRALLRRARRLRLTLKLEFTPLSGRPLARRTALTIRTRRFP